MSKYTNRQSEVKFTEEDIQKARAACVEPAKAVDNVARVYIQPKLTSRELMFFPLREVDTDAISVHIIEFEKVLVEESKSLVYFAWTFKGRVYF